MLSDERLQQWREVAAYPPQNGKDMAMVQLIDEVSALRTKRDKLADIVRELAEDGPYLNGAGYRVKCLSCEVIVDRPQSTQIEVHNPTCLWRRAKEMQDE